MMDWFGAHSTEAAVIALATALGVLTKFVIVPLVRAVTNCIPHEIATAAKTICDTIKEDGSKTREAFNVRCPVAEKDKV